MKTAFTISAIITILCLINMFISIVGFQNLILATYFGAFGLLMIIIMKITEPVE